MKIIAVVILLFSAFILEACAKKVETKSYSYDLTENGCRTENQTFSSREEMCDGLKNDSLNHNCAQDLRFEKFKSDCSDRSW